MIRSVPMNARFSFAPERATFSFPNSRVGRIGRMGASASVSFNPLSAGISAGVGLASTAIAGWMQSIQLSHDAMTATTLIVNGLAAQLQNNLNAYMAEPNPSCADQRQALNNYDQAIQWLQSPAACGNPNYGHAGNACVSDRIGSGAKWPWVQYYRDPIANDPRLSSLGCDTGNEVLLPSLTTGTYEPAPVTSTGGSSTTGETAATIATSATAAAAATGTPAMITPSGTPNIALYALGALGLVLLARSL